MNREEWLNQLAHRMAPLFDELGAPLPENIRIAIGFTSAGLRSGRLGECWDKRSSTDGHFEIWLRPDLAEKDFKPVEFAAHVGHELVHAAVGCENKHNRKFVRVAKGLGLAPPYRCKTTTMSTDQFRTKVEPIVAAIGALPHARLNTEGPSTRPKKQATRRFKCVCPQCDYLIETTRIWLETRGIPTCTPCGVLFEAQGFQPREPKATKREHTSDSPTIENFTRGIPWRRVLGFKDDEGVTLVMANDRYRELIKRCHPDIAGNDEGSTLQTKQLTVAIAEARAELEGREEAAGCEAWN